MNTSPSPQDLNLLLGVLAFQLDFVTQQQLIDAMQAWMANKKKSLGAIFVEKQYMTKERQQMLMMLVMEHVRQHGNDPQRSLAAVQLSPGLCDQLQSLGDRRLSESMSILHTGMSGSGEAAMFTLPHAAPQPDKSAPRRYHVLRPLAEGGLGIVSVANDTEVTREVALKEIKPRFADHVNSRARFLQEAEITGRLEHPCIVPVYGIGTYPDGRPFYAMRMIRGKSMQEAIAEFHGIPETAKTSGARTLALRELLQRFIDVCNAIEYAHSRGIVHRDIKPANIMLGKYRETLVVDWGLAKAVGQKEETLRTEETMIVPELGSESTPTRMGEVVGTVAFMSPEQAGGRQQEVGPASDIFSLGATLYNLLTNALAQQGDELGRLLRDIQSGHFRKPREVNSRVPRPLEAICLKAMALHPRDRYPSAAALASDIEHYLADEPLAAYQEPIDLRVRRWLRKHPKTVATWASAVLLGTLFLAYFLYDAEQDKKAKDAANLQLSQQQRETERARVTAETVQSTMLEAFRRPDPERDGKTITVYEVLLSDAIPKAINWSDDPHTGLVFCQTIGETLYKLGLYEEAIPVFEKAIALMSSAGEMDPLKRNNLQDLLDNAYTKARRFDQAVSQWEQRYNEARQQLGEDHEETISIANQLGSTYTDAERYDDALRLLKRVLAREIELHGDKHPNVAVAKNNLAEAYRGIGDLAQTLQLQQETLALARELFGDDHPNTMISRFNVAQTLHEMGRIPEALPAATDTLKLRETKLGPDHPDTILSLRQVTAMEVDRGDFAAAESLARTCLTRMEQLPSVSAYDLARVRTNLAESLLGLDNIADANRELDLAWTTLEELVPSSPDRLRAELLRGHAYAKAQQWEQAEPLLLATYQTLRAGLNKKLAPRQRWYVRRACEYIVDLYRTWNRPDEVQKWERELDELNSELEYLRTSPVKN